MFCFKLDTKLKLETGMNTLLKTLLLVSITACASGSNNPPNASPGTSATGSSAVPGSPKLEVKTVVSGLDTPWEIAFLPNGDDLLVSERGGLIRLIRNQQVLAQAWLDLRQLSPPARERGEGGLLGLVLDPAHASNGYAYVAYTTEVSGQALNRLIRVKANGDQASFDKLLLEVPAGTNHNGGRIAFGPDGKLYWAMGENFEGQLAQDLKSPVGKILRLNPDGSQPADNPYDSYVWSYGHRNPQGLAWDDQGHFYASEHGPSGEKGCCQDELNLIKKGQNYGWPVISGDEQREGMIQAVVHSGSTLTWAPGDLAWISQGALKGSLLMPGLRGQALYRIVIDPAAPDQDLSFETFFDKQLGRLRTVAQAPDGRIYLLTSNRDGRGSASAEDDRILEVIVN